MSEITCCKEFRRFQTGLEKRKKTLQSTLNAITANNATINRNVLILIRATQDAQSACVAQLQSNVIELRALCSRKQLIKWIFFHASS